MPVDNRGQEYTYKSSGINPQGNHYCTRNYGSSAPNQNSFHYSNRNGSYYYSNPDGSTYFNDGKGSAIYTSPEGKTKLYGRTAGSQQSSPQGSGDIE